MLCNTIENCKQQLDDIEKEVAKRNTISRESEYAMDTMHTYDLTTTMSWYLLLSTIVFFVAYNMVYKKEYKYTRGYVLLVSVCIIAFFNYRITNFVFDTILAILKFLKLR